MMKCDGKMHISTNELLCSSCTATVVVHTYSHIIINFLHDNVERCEMHMYMMTVCIEPVRITFDPRVCLYEVIYLYMLRLYQGRKYTFRFPSSRATRRTLFMDKIFCILMRSARRGSPTGEFSNA